MLIKQAESGRIILKHLGASPLYISPISFKIFWYGLRVVVLWHFLIRLAEGKGSSSIKEEPLCQFMTDVPVIAMRNKHHLTLFASPFPKSSSSHPISLLKHRNESEWPPSTVFRQLLFFNGVIFQSCHSNHPRNRISKPNQVLVQCATLQN